MTKLIIDEYCILCLGSGLVQDDPQVIDQNEDGTDILSQPVYRRCRCVEEVGDDEEEEEEDHSCLEDDDDNSTYF